MVILLSWLKFQLCSNKSLMETQKRNCLHSQQLVYGCIPKCQPGVWVYTRVYYQLWLWATAQGSRREKKTRQVLDNTNRHGKPWVRSKQWMCRSRSQSTKASQRWDEKKRKLHLTFRSTTSQTVQNNWLSFLTPVTLPCHLPPLTYLSGPMCRAPASAFVAL